MTTEERAQEILGEITEETTVFHGTFRGESVKSLRTDFSPEKLSRYLAELEERISRCEPEPAIEECGMPMGDELDLICGNLKPCRIHD